MQSWRLDEDAYVALLTKLIAETPHLVNRPPTHIPREAAAAQHVLARLAPYSAVTTTAANGETTTTTAAAAAEAESPSSNSSSSSSSPPLTVHVVEYHEGRTNIVIRYRNGGDGSGEASRPDQFCRLALGRGDG